MKNYTFILAYILVSMNLLSAQEEIMLYPNGPAESNKITVSESKQRVDFVVNISEPRLYSYLADKEKANGTAVLICPGGGYSGLAFQHEGIDIAKWFNELGISTFILHYRMPNGHCTIPLKDAQKALSIIHLRAKEWNINKTKIERPAFMILGYPVITMDNALTNKGSRNNLLGQNPTIDLVQFYSNELQVTKKTPPTFIVHARDDKVVPIANSENFYKALRTKKVSAQLQIYDLGGHGFGMRKKGIPADNWDQELKIWLKKQELI